MVKMALNMNQINGGNSDNIEMASINKDIEFIPHPILTGAGTPQTPQTPKPKRTPASKKIQFTTPECSNVIPVPVNQSSSPRLIPNRRREEMIVLANLRKRVAAVDLTRRRGDDQNANDVSQQPNGAETTENRTTLSKGSSKRDVNSGEESPKSPKSMMLQDKDFILDCLCWHNEYRARHHASALTVSSELCEYAQQWANHLASTNEFYYRAERNLGQNLFCCPVSALVTDLTGQEVASYWYSAVKRYNFFKNSNLLHTNVNAGHFSQMVWINTRHFGIGKAASKTGKIFVVAFYYPPGNIVGEFQRNVFPPIQDNEKPGGVNSTATPPPVIDLENNPITSILKTGTTN